MKASDYDIGFAHGRLGMGEPEEDQEFDYYVGFADGAADADYQEPVHFLRIEVIAD